MGLSFSPSRTPMLATTFRQQHSSGGSNTALKMAEEVQVGDKIPSVRIFVMPSSITFTAMAWKLEGTCLATH